MPSSWNSSIVALAGARCAAARRALRLYDSRRRLPTIPRMLHVLVIGRFLSVEFDAGPRARQGLRVQSPRGSGELRIHKHAEVHEAVPSVFLHQGSDFTGSLAIGDFDSEHVFSFSQHRLVPTYKFVWKITEEPVLLLESLNQINAVLPVQKGQN